MLELKQNRRKTVEKVGVNKQCFQIDFNMYLWIYLFVKSKEKRQEQ